MVLLCTGPSKVGTTLVGKVGIEAGSFGVGWLSDGVRCDGDLVMVVC